MPPVMGAAAFLMAEMTNIPYSTIIIAAIVPAVLYFTGIMLMVHFEAKKLHLQGLPDEDIPHLGHLMLTKWYLLLPLVVFSRHDDERLYRLPRSFIRYRFICYRQYVPRRHTHEL